MFALKILLWSGIWYFHPPAFETLEACQAAMPPYVRTYRGREVGVACVRLPSR